MRHDEQCHGILQAMKTQITFGSLFAGIGGFDLGFERAGMTCKWQVEIDSYCQRVLAKHWPQVMRHDDVRTWPQANAERVDVICAGFPCQDISYAGKGAGLNGERSGLFFDVCRIAREMEPRVIVLENVAALLTRGMGDVLGSLASIGFDAEWHCIPAAAVGAPHIRDRVFILGYANGNRWNARKQARKATRHWIPAVATSSYASSMADTRRKHGKRWPSVEEQANGKKAKRNEAINNTERRSQVEHNPRPRSLQCQLWWQSEPSVGRVADGVPHRVDRLKGLGNAVVPQVAEFIAKSVVELFEISTGVVQAEATK
jgi:DNA (cytosine-5)-methyltransferase 1